jgi:predicted small lipoprotein YifL
MSYILKYMFSLVIIFSIIGCGYKAPPFYLQKNKNIEIERVK